MEVFKILQIILQFRSAITTRSRHSSREDAFRTVLDLNWKSEPKIIEIVPWRPLGATVPRPVARFDALRPRQSESLHNYLAESVRSSFYRVVTRYNPRNTLIKTSFALSESRKSATPLTHGSMDGWMKAAAVAGDRSGLWLTRLLCTSRCPRCFRCRSSIKSMSFRNSILDFLNPDFPLSLATRAL